MVPSRLEYQALLSASSDLAILPRPVCLSLHVLDTLGDRPPRLVEWCQMQERCDFYSRSSTYIHPEPCKGWAMSPQPQTSFWRRKDPLFREALLQFSCSWHRILALLPGLDYPHFPGVFWSAHRIRNFPRSICSSAANRSLMIQKDRDESIPCYEHHWVRWIHIHACIGIPGVFYPQNSTAPSSWGFLW